MLRALVDPSQAPLRLPPKDEDKLLVAAKGSWVLAYDNLSGMPAWLSDALCCLATGTAYTKRSLYTDDDEHIIEATRPVIVNGIDDMTGRPDFARRALSIDLPQLKEAREEATLWREFEEARPYILGALCDALSGILAVRDRAQATSLPSMADFARFGIAAEAALGWPDGSFLAAFQESQSESAAVALESDLVALAVRRFVERLDFPKWRGTSAELLPRLAAQLDVDQLRSHWWPRNASQLANRILRAAPVLRRYGIDASRLRSRGERHWLLTRAAAPENRGKSPSPGATPAQSKQLRALGAENEVASDVAASRSSRHPISPPGDGGWRQGGAGAPEQRADFPSEGDGGDGGDAATLFPSRGGKEEPPASGRVTPSDGDAE